MRLASLLFPVFLLKSPALTFSPVCDLRLVTHECISAASPHVGLCLLKPVGMGCRIESTNSFLGFVFHGEQNTLSIRRLTRWPVAVCDFQHFSARFFYTEFVLPSLSQMIEHVPAVCTWWTDMEGQIFSAPATWTNLQKEFKKEYRDFGISVWTPANYNYICICVCFLVFFSHVNSGQCLDLPFHTCSTHRELVCQTRDRHYISTSIYSQLILWTFVYSIHTWAQSDITQISY